MLQTLRKWKVTLEFGTKTETFWLYDDNYHNVLRKAAEYQFTENGLEQPLVVTIR